MSAPSFKSNAMLTLIEGAGDPRSNSQTLISLPVIVGHMPQVGLASATVDLRPRLATSCDYV
jgi:hypothetical protein